MGAVGIVSGPSEGNLVSVTAKLLRLYRVDGQLRGLQSRLAAAERFLAEQTRLLEQLNAKRAGLEAQVKQLAVGAAGHEGEIARLDARAAQLRDQMNATKTNKEYQAFLVELNTIKVDRSRLETAALEQMTRSDELKAQLAQLDAERVEREKMRQVAAGERDKRHEEIRERVAELKAQRESLAAEVPGAVLAVFEQLVRQRGDGAMSPLEEQDRRRHEYTCGGCMMAMPVEAINTLLTRGDLTRCVSCGCILYLEEATVQAMQPAASKR